MVTVNFPMASAQKLVFSAKRPSARIVPHMRHVRPSIESTSASSLASSSSSFPELSFSQNNHPAEASPESIFEPSVVVLIWSPLSSARSRRKKPPCRTGKSRKRRRKKACEDYAVTNLAKFDSQKRTKDSKFRALPTGL